MSRGAWKKSWRRTGAVAVLSGAAATMLVAAGCGGVSGEGDNLVAGKEAFIAKCGSCHILERAGTKGVIGPNLDEAFQQSLKDGFKRDTIAGIIHEQILYPNRNGVMPAKLADGDLALDIAHYVSSVVAKPGKDTGALADVGRVKQQPLAIAKAGVLKIPADPTGQLLYAFKNAKATAGPLNVQSLNASQTQHDIAISGAGVDAKGEVVKDGGTSKFDVTLKPGKYDFFCTVPGHRQAGMQGVLTVT